MGCLPPVDLAASGSRNVQGQREAVQERHTLLLEGYELAVDCLHNGERGECGWKNNKLSSSSSKRQFPRHSSAVPGSALTTCVSISTFPPDHRRVAFDAPIGVLHKVKSDTIPIIAVISSRSGRCGIAISALRLYNAICMLDSGI